MFSKGTKVKFFHSYSLNVIENEVNTFIETLPEEYQISYMKYYTPKYADAQYVVSIIYEPRAVYNWNETMAKGWISDDVDGIKLLVEE